MKTFFKFKKLFAVCFLFVLIKNTKAQNPTFIFPDQSWQVGNATTTNSLPAPGTSVGYNAGSYLGFPSNCYPDLSGNPAFFVVDGTIYNKNGWKICDMVSPYTDLAGIVGQPSRAVGKDEICIVPVPGSCSQYYVFSSAYCSSTAFPTSCTTISDAPENTPYGIAQTPVYTVIDMAGANPFIGSGVPNGELGSNITPSLAPGKTSKDLYVATGTPQEYTGAASACSPYYGDQHYAATKEYTDNTGNKFRLLFVANNQVLLIYKITSTTISYLTQYDVDDIGSGPALFGEGFASGFNSELEIYEGPNYIKVAFDATNNVGTDGFEGNICIAVLPFNPLTPSTFSLPINQTGALSITSGMISLSACSTSTQNAQLTGLEFSPDGNSIYCVHNSTACTGAGVEVYDIGPSSIIGNTPNQGRKGIISGGGLGIGGIEFLHSQIELGKDASGAPVMYLIDTQTGTLAQITGPLNNPSLGLTVNDPFPVSINLYAQPTDLVYSLPDQIDGDNYITNISNSVCCYLYSSFNVNQAISFLTGNTIINPPSTGQTVLCNLTGSSAPPVPITFYPTTNVNANITIPTGANVTFKNCTLRFTPPTKLSVMYGTNSGTTDGGILILNNALLTVDGICDANKMWQGVEVLGFNFSIVTSQGTLGSSPMGWMQMINGSKIEHAITGVRLGASGSSTTWDGGVLQTGISFIENCQTGVEIKPCGNITSNQTNFKKTVFQTTQQLKDPTKNPIAHVKITDARGVTFWGCTFQNSTAYPAYNWSYYGIQSNNATFTVKDFGINHNVFKNLSYGIYAQAVPLSRTVNCSGAQFTYNQTGAYLSTVDFATFQNNTFKVLDNNSTGNTLSGPLPYGVGLYLDNCTQFTVTVNTFQNNSVTPANNSSYNYTFGCIVRNSDFRAITFNSPAYQSNFIFKNTFQKINWGCQAIGTNYALPDCYIGNNDGLKYFCNTFHAPIKDVEIGVSSGGIDYHQGWVGLSWPADNSFSTSTASYLTQFLHPNTVINKPTANNCVGSPNYNLYANYVWSNSVPNPYPVVVTSPWVSTSTASDLNGCGATPFHLVINNPYTDLPNYITSFKSQITVAKNKIDCGNTQNLLNVISANGNPSQTLSLLQNCTPYLSSDVLISYINNPHYPDGHKQQLLSSCSPLLPEVKNAIQNSTMSGGTKNVVDSKQKGLSPMGTLKDQISFFSAEAQWCFGELVRTYLNDTITPGALDSAQIWIKRANGPTVDKGRQIRLALEMKDSTTAANALQQMIIAEGPNSSNVKVHDAIIKLHKKNIRLTLQTDTVMLNTVQQVYADVNTPDARLLAQSLLSYVNEIPPTPIYELMPVTSSSRFAASSEPNPEKEEKKLLNCYPNPFNQNTTITASVPDGTTNAILIVHDVMGREVARYTLVIGNNEINFNSDNIGKGMLMYSLIIDGNRTETKVMMKE